MRLSQKEISSEWLSRKTSRCCMGILLWLNRISVIQSRPRNQILSYLGRAHFRHVAIPK